MSSAPSQASYPTTVDEVVVQLSDNLMASLEELPEVAKATGYPLGPLLTESLTATMQMLGVPIYHRVVTHLMASMSPEHPLYQTMRYNAVYCDVIMSGGNAATFAVTVVVAARREGVDLRAEHGKHPAEFIVAEEMFRALQRSTFGNEIPPGPAMEEHSDLRQMRYLSHPKIDQLLFEKTYSGYLGDGQAIRDEAFTIAEREFLNITRDASGTITAVDLRPEFNIALLMQMAEQAQQKKQGQPTAPQGPQPPKAEKG